MLLTAILVELRLKLSQVAIEVEVDVEIEVTVQLPSWYTNILTYQGEPPSWLKLKLKLRFSRHLEFCRRVKVIQG